MCVDFSVKVLALAVAVVCLVVYCSERKGVLLFIFTVVYIYICTYPQLIVASQQNWWYIASIAGSTILWLKLCNIHCCDDGTCHNQICTEKRNMLLCFRWVNRRWELQCMRTSTELTTSCTASSPLSPRWSDHRPMNSTTLMSTPWASMLLLLLLQPLWVTRCLCVWHCLSVCVPVDALCFHLIWNFGCCVDHP